MAQARIWNATPITITVTYEDYNWLIFEKRYVLASKGTRNIGPFSWLAYDNLTSYLTIKVGAAESDMIEWHDSWQYVVTLTTTNFVETLALSKKYDLLSLKPSEEMSSEKTKYEDGTYLSDWMTSNWSVIKDRPIWEIVLPGSHDAGSYSSGNTGYVRNQTYDIGEQLKKGIRYFDIRVTKRDDGSYVMEHGTYPPGKNEQNFSDAVTQIKNFADANPQEILIVSMKGSFDSGDTTAYVDFQDYYINILKGYLVILDVDSTTKVIDGTKYTPEKMHSNNQNIIIISDHGEEPTYSPPPISGRDRYYQWKTKYVGAYIYRSSWDNKQTFAGVLCDLTPQQKVDFVEKQIPNWLKGDHQYPGNKTNEGCKSDNPSSDWRYVGNYFNEATATIWTPNIIGDTVHLLQPAILEWTNSWANDSTIMDKMNIILLDAIYSSWSIFPEVTDLIPSIINLNIHK